MRIPRTLSWYLLREVSLYAGLGILAVGGVLVVQNALRHIQNLAGMGLTLGDAAQLVTVLVAQFSTYAVPIAFLFGVMVAMYFGNPDDEEVSAWTALRQFLRSPVVQLLGPESAPANLIGLNDRFIQDLVDGLGHAGRQVRLQV